MFLVSLVYNGLFPREMPVHCYILFPGHPVDGQTVSRHQDTERPGSGYDPEGTTTPETHSSVSGSNGMNVLQTDCYVTTCSLS